MEGAFEEGSYEGFAAWLEGFDDGSILLDSVDEARLREPSDFERAIKLLARSLGAAKQRAHMVITGRTTAWRPKTDLALCRQHLPYVAPAIEESGDEGAGKERPNLRERAATDGDEPMYKVVAFNDLSPSQIELFSKAKGVRNIKSFMEAVERADAWSFTSRPQDLEDLVAFWNEHGRIGSRVDLMENGIRRRLEERDQRRADARPVAADRVRAGARAVAAACTLAQSQTVRVPDGSANAKGLPIKDILSDWDDRDCATLLSRPIFDEAIYGTVRFHHRTVREYLTAEWFSQLLKQGTSRRRVEELFFREQYELEVVVPSLRPVLPWLALMDARIGERVRKLAPEVFFEGGEPAKLPLVTRRQILNQVCDQIAGGASGRSVMDYAAVQRFSGADLTEDVVALLKKHKGNSNLRWLLLRMVWQGQLKGALKEAKRVALEPNAERYARIAAFRAVGALGSVADKVEIRAAFFAEPAWLDRDWLAELLKETVPTAETVEWLFDCLSKVAKRKPYDVDVLSGEIAAFSERATPTLLPSIVARANALLESEPFVERRHCEVSADYAWILVPASVAVQRLVEMRSREALSSTSLGILHKLPLAQEFGRLDFKRTKLQLVTLVPAWPELNLALFWHVVSHQRARQRAERGKADGLAERGTVRTYVRFDPGAFDTVLACASRREHPDDKLVALTLAHRLYLDAGRPAAGRQALRSAVEDDPVLSERLKVLMRPGPPSEDVKKHRKLEADWKRRNDARHRKQAGEEARWRQAMRANAEALREPKLKRPQSISNWQYHVHERMREIGGKSSSRKERDWTVLEDEFGPEIARAFRDGVVAYWRRHKPKLRSEGAPADRLNFSEIFGLTGLDIEARETEGWPSNLTEAEAELAFRYAMHELNGFPDWMPRLFGAFPELVGRLSLAEIGYELGVEDKKKESFYLLYDISWSGDWLWDAVASDVYEAVRKREPTSLGNLRYVLKVINGSSLPDSDIVRLSRRKAKSIKNSRHAAAWYATWVGVEPEAAVPALRSRLAEIVEKGARTTFAMLFVTHLGGGRRGGAPGVRQAYRTPAHLKELFLLMHEHIKREEDNERAGQGAYSPELRDEAQDARNHLFNLLNEIPGKETYLALEDISRAHPDVEARPWFVTHAKVKAELDADNPAWTPAQVREFELKLERTPANNRDLFDLAAMRIADLKDDLENGDSSIADTLRRVTEETEMRKVIGNWCRERSGDRYHVPQEEELADSKRPDLRFLGAGFDGPVPAELKLADKWSGPKLYERMEVQLCGDYLRDRRSSRGIFLLVYGGAKKAGTCRTRPSQYALTVWWRPFKTTGRQLPTASPRWTTSGLSASI